jgi:DNA-binding transcriptional MerR regulator
MTMTVSHLAKASAVTAETVRYYTRLGLLVPSRDPHNGYQLFDAKQLKRLRFINQSRSLGFSLKEIAAILEHEAVGDSPCPMVRDMLQQRVPAVEAKIADLQQQLERMQSALAQWQKMPDGAPDGHRICHLIEAWEQH